MKNADSQLGLQRETVRLVASDPQWPAAFQSEADRLRARVQLAGLAPLTFEHIGSTAVRGLIAKPILDFMAGYAVGAEPGPYIGVLESAGYERRPQDMPNRELLVLGSEVARTHHLNLVEVDGSFWRKHLSFRESLRNDSGLAAAYAALKRELATRHPADRAAYSAGKEAFVRRVTMPTGSTGR
jgi:GrpB-like predicted nucleotidyltransferase (UPF0157 family)